MWLLGAIVNAPLAAWVALRCGSPLSSLQVAFAVGAYWGLLLMKVGIVGFTWYAMLHGGSLTVLAWMEAGYAGVIVWNYLQLLKHKAGA